MENRGIHLFPMVILFGVILAILTGAVFALYHERQQEARIVIETQSLADELALTAFSAFSSPGVQPTLSLPGDIGGSVYHVSISENRTFVIKISKGRLVGKEFLSTANVVLRLENADFALGGKVYFQRVDDVVIVSASPIRAPYEFVEITPQGEPPEFYHFAKENPMEAAAIIAAYFHALVDVGTYRWQDESTLLVMLENGGMLRMQGRKVDNAWLVQEVENFVGEPTGVISCPSSENAWRGGWLYSPSQALAALRSRSWRRVTDNVAVSIPSDTEINAAAITTKVGTFLAYRVEWENCTVYYRAVPWWHMENTPGFVFQSEPELEPIT